MFTKVLKMQNSMKNKIKIVSYPITFEISILSIAVTIFLSVFLWVPVYVLPLLG